MKQYKNTKEKGQKMKSLLDKLNEVEGLLRTLHKMDSKMRAGQWIDAWRENGRLIAFLNNAREKILVDQEQEKPKDDGKLSVDL